MSYDISSFVILKTKNKESGRSDVREEINRDGSLYGLYTYNGLLKGNVTYEAVLISDIS